MDADDRLELIALIARSSDWDAIVKIGEALLDCHWPADIFTGESGDPGPEYVVALRNALARVNK